MKGDIETIIFKDREAAALRAALLVQREIEKKPSLVLGLATGKTMIPLYRELVLLYKKKKISFKKVRTFNLDEYYGLSSENKNSHRYFMEKYFFNLVDIPVENINFLNGTTKDWCLECARYESAIKKAGGIDLLILGLGANGHIAFNEPGSFLNSKTRLVKLSETTRKNNSKIFSSLNRTPKYALTMGLSTILKSRKIILLAFGRSKRGILKLALKGKISSRVPASFLRRHKNVVFVLDEDSRGRLSSGLSNRVAIA